MRCLQGLSYESQTQRNFHNLRRGSANPGPVSAMLRTRGTRNCAAHASQDISQQQVTETIGSVSIERSIEKQTKSEIHKDFHSAEKNRNAKPRPTQNPAFLDQTNNNPANYWQGQSYGQLFIEAIRKRELLRAQREEEVRRELAVGTGPEVPRS